MQGAIVSEFGDRKDEGHFSGGQRSNQAAIVDPGVNGSCQLW
jgi:hypothetical protein